MGTWRVAGWIALGVSGAYLAGYVVARRTGVLTHFVGTVADIDPNVRHVRCVHRIDPPPLFLPEGRRDARIATLYRPVIDAEIATWTAYRHEWTNQKYNERCGFLLRH